MANNDDYLKMCVFNGCTTGISTKRMYPALRELGLLNGQEPSPRFPFDAELVFITPQVKLSLGQPKTLYMPLTPRRGALQPIVWFDQDGCRYERVKGETLSPLVICEVHWDGVSSITYRAVVIVAIGQDDLDELMQHLRARVLLLRKRLFNVRPSSRISVMPMYPQVPDPAKAKAERPRPFQKTPRALTPSMA